MVRFVTMDTPTEELLTIGDAALVLQVSVQTVRRWEESGYLTAIRTPGNQRRFRRSDVEGLLTPPAGDVA